MQKSPIELWLIRHGETEWSISGQHTSRTDIPLTDHGRQRAVEIHEYLQNQNFSQVLTSPEVIDRISVGDVIAAADALRVRA